MRAASVAALIVMLGQGSAGAAAGPRLTSMTGKCVLEVKPTGGGHASSVGAWLVCDASEPGFLLIHPRNLLGHVAIGTAPQALEYVRLFSSGRWHSLFPDVPLVEVLPGESDGVFTLEASKFLDIGSEATVVEHRTARGKKLFEVKRVVVSLQDLNLYEVTETVSEVGYYELVSQRLLYEDATRLGLLIVGGM